MVNPAQFVGRLLGNPDFLADHWTPIFDRIVHDPAVLTGSRSRGRRGQKCVRASDIGLQLGLSWFPPQGDVVFLGSLRTKHLSDVSVYAEVTLNGVLLLMVHV
jgi:hypothetical protein